MTLQRTLLRLFIAVFFLNSSGLVFSAEQLVGGAKHEVEYVSSAGADADCESNLAACKAHCQSHCAQHFTVLPSEIFAQQASVAGLSSPPEYLALAPPARGSSLFRPPRIPTL